jgi:hypothetical protein
MTYKAMKTWVAGPVKIEVEDGHPRLTKIIHFCLRVLATVVVAVNKLR